MNVINSRTEEKQRHEVGVGPRAAEKEGVWQQIQQHFQTTQSSLSLRLICEGKEVQQIADIKSGVREAARLFNLQDSPLKAEELVASQENLFNRKCQQWEQAAKSAEARERAKATGGGAGGASSAANRRRLEAANIAVRNQVSNSKQCFRRLRTALKRGVALGASNNTSNEIPTTPPTENQTTKSITAEGLNHSHPSAVATATESMQEKPQSKFLVSLQNLIGEGLSLEYEAAPYMDPLSEQGLKSREAIWTESQPYCLIVQWEDSRDCSLKLKFWIVPKRPELVPELRSEVPRIFLHKKVNHGAERLNFEWAVHNNQNGPLTSEMNQLLNRLESERFMASELDQKAQLSYLTCAINTELDFDTAVQQSYLLELL